MHSYSVKGLLPLVLLAVLLGAFLRWHLLGEVPPGLHYDFAANAIIANDIAFNGWRGVFITAYTGKEVLFFYTAGLIFKFVGSSIFALQFTAALYGVLGIASCYFATRELLRGELDSPWIAAFSAAILSFTFMHVVWSRYGERAVTEPFVQGLAVGFLFRAFRASASNAPERRASGMRDMALAGAFTGLAAYTYLAARLFPIPVAVALGVWLFQNRGRVAIRVGIFIAAAAIVFAPLGWFFLARPETFLVRASQLAPKEGEFGLLLQGLSGALGMIFISGEPYDRFNIPGRPIFGPLLGAFFVIGLLTAVGQLWRAVFPRSSAARRAPADLIPHLFLLVYLPIFLLPTALAVHDIFPSNVRAMGLLPLLAVFPARGVAAAVRWLSSTALRSPPAVRALPPLALLFTMLGGAATTYYSYFEVWARAPGLYYANDTDLVNAARWLNQTNTRGLNVYLSAIHYRHPTVADLARDYASFRWLTGGQALAVPEGPALYVFPHAAPPPEDWIAEWVPTAAPLGPDGSPDFRAYRFDSPPPLPEFAPAPANFGNIVALTGYRAPGAGVYDFRLRVLNPPDRGDYRLVVDLVDSAGYHWAQGFNDSYFSEQWQVGETILMRIKIPIEIGTPPGEYQLLATIYSPSAKAGLPALTAEGYAAAYAAVGPIMLTPTEPQPYAQPLTTVNGLGLLRFDPPPAAARPGEPLPFTLYWQAASRAAGDALIRTTVGSLVIESAYPAHGAYLTRQMEPGEMAVDRHAPRLPRELAPGKYEVKVDGYLIGAVSVSAVERQFASPSPAVGLRESFGNVIELIGYDAAADSITLYWRALTETDADYTAFVHVLDADGNIIAQRDAQPRGGQYPTSLWMKDEYVADRIHLPLAAGAAIEIGWYAAETGRRLRTGSSDAVVISLP